MARQSPSNLNRATCRHVWLLSAVLFFIATGCGGEPAPVWHDFESAPWGFRASFPGVASFRESGSSARAGVSPGGELFLIAEVTILKMPQALSHLEAVVYLDDQRKNVTTPRERFFVKDVTDAGGLPGIEVFEVLDNVQRRNEAPRTASPEAYALQSKFATVRKRIFVRDDLIYNVCVEAVAETGDRLHTAEADRFLNAFQCFKVQPQPADSSGK